MQSPFEPEKSKIDADSVRDMFEDMCREAVAKLKSDEVKSTFNDSDEVLIFLDYILIDAVLAEHNLHSEEFRALLTKHQIA